jgi:hypothetical protein
MKHPRAIRAGVTVQTPSPQPSPARGEEVRELAGCATYATLGTKESERLRAGYHGRR